MAFHCGLSDDDEDLNGIKLFSHIFRQRKKWQSTRLILKLKLKSESEMVVVVVVV